MADPIAETPAAPLPATPAAPAGESEFARKKREGEIKARGAALKAEKDALNKQRNDILAEQKMLESEKKELAEFKKWRSQATTDPDAFLGPIYGKEWRDVLAKATAGDATPLEIRKLREEWEADRKANADKEARAKADAETKAAAAAKAARDEEEREEQDYVKEISTTWIEQHKDEFPTLWKTGTAAEVAKKVRAIFMETGEMPDEVAVAKQLEEQLDKILEGVYEVPKWQQKLAAKFKPASAVRQPEPPSFEIKRKSISQDMGAGTKPPAKPVSREERRKQLLDNWDQKVPQSK